MLSNRLKKNIFIAANQPAFLWILFPFSQTDQNHKILYISNIVNTLCIVVLIVVFFISFVKPKWESRLELKKDGNIHCIFFSSRAITCCWRLWISTCYKTNLPANITAKTKAKPSHPTEYTFKKLVVFYVCKLCMIHKCVI